MPITLPACLDFPLLAELPCVRLPAGAELCFGVPGVIPQSSFVAGAAALAGVNSALAPLSPLFDVLEVVQALGDTIKAVATLNPKKIAEALPNLISQLADLAGLFPPLAVPVFVMDLLALLALVLEGLADELDAVASYSARISVAASRADTQQWPGVQAAIACAEGHIALVLQHLGGQVGPLNRLIGLINGFMDLANLPPKLRIPCIAALDSGRIVLFIPILRQLAAILRALAGQIPQPGNRKSRVVPC